VEFSRRMAGVPFHRLDGKQQQRDVERLDDCQTRRTGRSSGSNCSRLNGHHPI
jgi:hypothetical protein